MADEVGTHAHHDVSRRRFIAGTGRIGLLAAAPAALRAGLIEMSPAVADGAGGHFFTEAELLTLRALCATLIPGPPVDRDPGAVEAGVPEFIDLLMASFVVELPHIFAGGPYSDRAGSEINYFADFLGLDPIDELTWRTRIEGSNGIAEREWNGPVKGWQRIYSDGLAQLDVLAERSFTRKPFHGSPRWLQSWIVLNPKPSLTDFLDLAFEHCVEGMYGNPEYGGNRDLAGWRYTRWPGDSQPNGYSNDAVSSPGDGLGDPPPGTDADSAPAAGSALAPNLPALMRTQHWRQIRS